ncbi:zinc finger CCCH domain-containing protein 47-like [Ipomoea triloba]|uniref:zinc finger CCCH domain-containing protein 47-like n=1 Tax=Ipomoea triloba TaxID=35885 RepID=UPI00125D6612|nr:zinc finger CCCH domain-containing protein 47-like [Ipomoea triloba]
MCSGSKAKLCSFDLDMEKKNGVLCKSYSKLLELSATDDVAGFICEVEEKGCDVNELSLWYGRKIGSKKMGLEERTPLAIASMYGSTGVLKYIIGTGKVDVNMACGSDGATALHCVVAGGSDSSLEVAKVLVGANADVNALDANGNKPGDLIASFQKLSGNLKRRTLGLLLKGGEVELGDEEEEQVKAVAPLFAKEGCEKKEYPIDTSLPDINTGIYGTDEFRMYSFKVKPCSRAYSHDWTECPFVHPGENARRRDPSKYTYTCVPCPEFKKGTCAKGDACEFAHGVFESWLHPAQYKTRLCKDETGCSRKVCFFAHKPEELRPLYASTGSAIPSPKSGSVSSMDTATLGPLALGSSLLMPTTSTPPMSPTVSCSSPMGGNTWQNKMNFIPPALQLSGSRLKTALNARDLDPDMELLSLESIRTQQQQQRQQLIEEMAGLSSPSRWNGDYNRLGDLKPTNLDDVFGSLDSSLSHLQGLSPKVARNSSSQLQSPTGLQIRQNMNQLRASYPSNISSSPARKPSTYGYDSSAAVAAAVMNSRSAAFAKRSHSFIDRGGVIPRSSNSPPLMTSKMSDWGSPDGKLDWGFNGEELNKLKKSASFATRNGSPASTRASFLPSHSDEPDVSWVHSLVKDVSSGSAGLYDSEQKRRVHDSVPSWIDQMYIDQEQVVA